MSTKTKTQPEFKAVKYITVRMLTNYTISGNVVYKDTVINVTSDLAEFLVSAKLAEVYSVGN